MLPVLLVLLAPGLLLAQQCKQPSDCTSLHAPHCSRWGWCQWTADYGDEGPREDLPTSGYCNSNKDCVPRAPFCSRQGYCTQRPGPRGKNSGGQKKKPGNRNQIGGRAQQQQQQQQQQHIGGRAQDRAGLDHPMQGGRSEKRNHRKGNRGQQQHSQRRSQESRGSQKRPTASQMAKPSQAKPRAFEEPRARGVLPSGTFLLSQMNAGFGQRRVDTVVQPEPRSFQPPQPPPSQQQVVRHEPQKFPSPKPRTTPAPVPVFDENRREKIDRQSSDYGQAYDYNIDYSNYDYYTDFEVQKTQPEVESNGEARRLEEALILENPPEGQSQGCLYDCVYDCVSITQLEAYRDCVDFCGKTCTNKK